MSNSQLETIRARLVEQRHLVELGVKDETFSNYAGEYLFSLLHIIEMQSEAINNQLEKYYTASDGEIKLRETLTQVAKLLGGE